MHTTQISAHFSDAEKEAAEQGLKAEPWQIYRPLVNPPDRINFNADEMATLMGMKDFECFNQVVALDKSHNSLVVVLTKYAEQRAELGAHFRNLEVNGEAVTGALTDSQMLQVRPKMIDANSIVLGAKVLAASNEKRSLQAILRLRTLYKEKLGVEFKFEFKAPAAD